MKKTISTGFLLFALSLAFMLTTGGCGRGNTENQEVLNNNQNIKKGNMEHLTVQTFKEKVFNYEVNKDWKFEGDLPCIVDFYADWCGPCKMVAPVLDELSNEYEGKIHVYKVDTDKEQELASVFGIKSIPSILFIPKDGQPQMSMGAMPKESFKQAIEEVLLKSKN
jgi:thioredoxin 1